MRRLEEIINELNAIKDTIYNEEVSTEVDVVFKRLIELNEIESELYETLILLYSNNKAEFDLLKHNHLVHSNKIIDSSISLVGLIKDLINEIELLKKDLAITKKKSNLLTMKNILIFIGVGVGLLTGAVIVIHYLPSESNELLDFIRDMSNSKLIK